MTYKKINDSLIKSQINFFGIFIILPVFLSIFGLDILLAPFLFAGLVISYTLVFIVKNSLGLGFFIKSVPTFVNIIFIIQLIVSPYREDVIKNIVNLFSFYLGLANFNIIAKSMIFNENLYKYFLKAFTIVGTAFIPLAPLSIIINGFQISNDGRFRLLNSINDNAGHGTAETGLILLFVSLAVDYIFAENSLVKENNWKLPFLKTITSIIGCILCIASGTRLGLFFTALFFFILIYNTLPRLLKVPFLMSVILALFFPYLLISLDNQILVETTNIILSNFQNAINGLLNTSIRFVNDEGHTLSSGRDKLFQIHQSIIENNFLVGVGHPLPLERYDWDPETDASSEAGLTIIAAKYGLPLAFPFFFPFFYIASKLNQNINAGSILSFEIFIIISVLLDCIYNGQLQNPYNIASFYWIFILVIFNRFIHNSKDLES